MENLEKLLAGIKKSFFDFYGKDKKVSGLYKRVRDGTANYDQAHEFAVCVGNCLAKAYKSNLELSMMDYETALSLLNDPLKRNHDIISKFCYEVQTILNNRYGLSIEALLPELNKDRIAGLATAVSKADTAEMAIGFFQEQVINFSQSVVDDAVEKNASFAADLGMKPQIIRTYEGPHDERGKMVDCEWCRDLEGAYDYEDVKASGSDVYKRHEGCRCTVSYVPGSKGSSQMRRKGNAFVRF